VRTAWYRNLARDILQDAEMIERATHKASEYGYDD
jgi:hypothetical protein